MVFLRFGRFLAFLGAACIACSCLAYINCLGNSTEGKVESKQVLKLQKLGVGILDIDSDVERENVLVMALNAGYRMIDIWEGDEVPVQNAISRSKIPREDIFVVVKLIFPNNTDRFDTNEAVLDILYRLGTTYIDLLLINFPFHKNAHFDVWKAMIDYQKSGKIRKIGVSNFRYEEILQLEKATGVFPSVVQLEINPFNQQSSLVKNLTNLGISIQAYSVLANGKKLDDHRLVKIAKLYDATTAQLMIQWCLQKGYSCITKSTKLKHLEDNINLGEFHLVNEDMKELDALNEGFVTNFNAEIPLNDDDQFNKYADEREIFSENKINKSTPKYKKGRRGDDFDDFIDYDSDANEAYDDENEAAELKEPQESQSKGQQGDGQIDRNTQKLKNKNSLPSARSRQELPKGEYNTIRDEF